MPIDFEALELPQQTDEELVIKPGIFKVPIYCLSSFGLSGHTEKMVTQFTFAFLEYDIVNFAMVELDD